MERGDPRQCRPFKKGADCWEPEAPQNTLRRESSEEPPRGGGQSLKSLQLQQEMTSNEERSLLPVPMWNRQPR